ncbi:MAG: glycosyltransferase, partial [Candidatus Spechtbacterales bacterium]
RIFVSFPGEYPEFSRDRIHLVGNPVRDMRGGAAANILEKLVLSDERPVVLVVGGSQGARQVNELMLEAAEELSAFVSIIHQTGEGNIAAVQKRAEQLSKRARQCYRPIAFLSEQDMRDAYAAAALVVSRAGSSVLFELALLKKPSILIPLMSAAAGHQEENARIYQAAGACALLNARTATPAELVTAVAGLVAAPKRLAQMGEAAGTFAKPQAAATIAQTILKI